MQVGHGTAGAVKGKRTKGALEHCRQVVSAYETAFSAYAAGKFERALAVLQENASDPPSIVLIERCKASCKCRLPRIGAESTYRRRSKIGSACAPRCIGATLALVRLRSETVRTLLV